MDESFLEQCRRGSGLELDREGRWLIAGSPVTHERTLQALDAGLRVRDDGEIVVHIGSQWAYVTAADTPFVVRHVRARGGRDGRPARFELEITGGRAEVLDPSTLRLACPSDLHCTLSDGVAARFGRAAMTELMPHLVESETPGAALALRMDRGDVPIGSAEEADPP